MPTIDMKQDPALFYSATAKAPTLITVPPRPYLMLDGTGDPNTSPDFQTGVPAMYSLAYGLRAVIKAATGTAYTVMPLEGLWTVREGGSYEDRASWTWTLLILQPDAADAAMFADVLAQTKKKKPNAMLDRVRFETYDEGLCVQMLHVGPFSTEPETFTRIEAFCAAHGYTRSKAHHEIYLSQIDRTPPEKLKTILRVQVTPT